MTRTELHPQSDAMKNKFKYYIYMIHNSIDHLSVTKIVIL